MITGMDSFQEAIHTVRCEQPESEVWRHLGLLATPSYAAAAPRQLFKDSLGNRLIADKLDGFAKCILQAREYFEASRSVTIATAPTLCYYGRVSLCAAVAIFRGRDVTLRSLPKSHGLTTDDLASCRDVLDAACRVDSSGVFPLIGALGLPEYCTYERWLPPSDQYIPVGPAHFAVALHRENSWLTRAADTKLVLRDLLSRLPDIGFEAWTHPGIRLSALACTVSLERMDERPVTSARFRIHCDDAEQADRLLEMMRASYPAWHHVAGEGGIHEFRTGDVPDPFAEPCPPLRDSTSGDTFVVLPGIQGTPVMPELLDWLAAGFITGSLTRYYPQVWLGRSRLKPETGLLTERFARTAPRRFPNLVLNLLYGRLFRFTS